MPGNWFTYTFGEGSTCTASTFMNAEQVERLNKQRKDSKSQWDISSDDSALVVSPRRATHTDHSVFGSSFDPPSGRPNLLLGMDNPPPGRSLGQPLHNYLVELLESGSRARRVTSTNRSDHVVTYSRLTLCRSPGKTLIVILWLIASRSH